MYTQRRSKLYITSLFSLSTHQHTRNPSLSSHQPKGIPYVSCNDFHLFTCFPTLQPTADTFRSVPCLPPLYRQTVIQNSSSTDLVSKQWPSLSSRMPGYSQLPTQPMVEEIQSLLQSLCTMISLFCSSIGLSSMIFPCLVKELVRVSMSYSVEGGQGSLWPLIPIPPVPNRSWSRIASCSQRTVSSVLIWPEILDIDGLTLL